MVSMFVAIKHVLGERDKAWFICVVDCDVGVAFENLKVIQHEGQVCYRWR